LGPLCICFFFGGVFCTSTPFAHPSRTSPSLLTPSVWFSPSWIFTIVVFARNPKFIFLGRQIKGSSVITNQRIEKFCGGDRWRVRRQRCFDTFPPSPSPSPYAIPAPFLVLDWLQFPLPFVFFPRWIGSCNLSFPPLRAPARADPLSSLLRKRPGRALFSPLFSALFPTLFLPPFHFFLQPFLPVPSCLHDNETRVRFAEIGFGPLASPSSPDLPDFMASKATHPPILSTDTACKEVTFPRPQCPLFSLTFGSRRQR